MADLNFLTEAFSEATAAPPQPPVPTGPDVDFLSQSFAQAAPSKRFQLEQELGRARDAGVGADIELGLTGAAEQSLRYAADPIGTVLKGLGSAGRLAAGGAADVGLEVGRLAGLTTQPSRWENVRDAAFTREEFPGPLPIEDALAQQPGVGAAFTRGILGTVRTAPTLATGATLTAATGGVAAPFVIYPALFGAESLYQTGDVGHAVKSAAVGAFYPAVGKLVGPASASLVNTLGLVNKPLAQKAIETTVDQALMQSATHLMSIPEYATMTPEERESAFFENTGAILVFTVPRVLGYAAGAPSEYEAVIRNEASRMRDSFRRQQEEDARTAGRTETAQAIRTMRGSTPGRRAAERIAEEEVANVPRITTEPAPQAPVPVREPTPAGVGAPTVVLPGVPRPKDAGAAPGATLPVAEQAAATLGLRLQRQPGTEGFPASLQFDYRPTTGERGFTFQMPEDATAEQIAARFNQKRAEFSAARDGDIVELMGYVGDLGRDAEGRPVINTNAGMFEIPQGGVPKVRLSVTPEGRIVRNGVIYEPSVGAGKTWRNAYNPENGWFRVRRVGGGDRIVISGPSSEYLVRRFSELYPEKQRSVSTKPERPTREATTSGVEEMETEVVDSPIDQFLFDAALKREKEGVPSAVQVKVAATIPVQPAPPAGKAVGKRVRGAKESARTRAKEVEATAPKAGKPTLTDKINAVFEVATTSQLAEMLVTGRLQPVDSLAQATISDRLRQIRDQYQKDPAAFLRQVELHIKRKAGTLTGEEASELFDRTKYTEEQSVSAGYVADLTDPGQMEKLRAFEWTLRDAPAPAPTRLLLSKNKTQDLPEFVMGHKKFPGDVIGAWIVWNPAGKEKDFISIRGRSPISSYRIPIAALPEGAAVVTKEGLSVDKQAVLDFLNDPVKRRATNPALSAAGKSTKGTNADRFHPDDIAMLLDQRKSPGGKPATGAGAPLGKTALPPDVLERIAPAPDTVVGDDVQMSRITRDSFERLLQTNPALVDTLLRRRAEELDDAFWASVRDELAKMPEYAVDPKAPDLLVASLRKAKEGGKELDWYASRGGTVVDQPLTVEAAQAVVVQMVGGSPANIRFISDPTAGLGRVSFLPGELPRIELNLSKHATPEAMRDTLLEELLHPLQSDPAMRPVMAQIEARITEVDLARQREAGYRPDELLNEAANELVRRLYAEHAESNVFRRGVNQVVLAVKRLFGLDLTDQQVALFLVNRALKNRRVSFESVPGERLVAKNAVITAPGEGVRFAITAHHGTPHTVDRFRIDKVDTGQGAQTYGWGLYFAERPEVGRQYAMQLGARGADGRLIDGAMGNEYSVRLEAEPGDFLDWDKPLSEQSPKVLALVNSSEWTGPKAWSSYTGGDLYRNPFAWDDAARSNASATHKRASDWWAAHGIKGIRYLDQGSRNSGIRRDSTLLKWGATAPGGIEHFFDTKEQAQAFVDRYTTYNYVIFDESIIRITHENGKEVPLREAIGGQPRVAYALESPEKVESYTEPMTHEPEFYRSMARVLNKGLVPPPVIARFDALSAGAKGELAKVFPGRVATYRDEAGNVVAGPTFREVMRDESMTPEQRSDYARTGLGEYMLYQHDRQKVFDRAVKTRVDLDAAVLKSITDTPRTNEAELLSQSLMSGIIDRIKAEREKSAEGVQINERIREGIENIDRLNDLLSQPVAMDRAIRGIANQVGRDELMASRPGEEALHLISVGTGFLPPTGMELTPRAWITALATHLDQLTRSDGTKSILAGREVIEAALYGLRQAADARQALLEVQMTGDGTLRKFNSEYMEDLRSKIPKGFNAILKKYAKAQVESDALTAAFKRVNKRIDTLTERETNLDEAISFLNEHGVHPEFVDFGRAVVEHSGARDIQFTRTGPIVTYDHPITGLPVKIEHTYDKGDQVDTVRSLMALAQSGLEYAARPDADPVKAVGWRKFADSMDDALAVASPDYDLLQDPFINPLKFITKSSFGILSESTFSRIPGFLKNETTRAQAAWAGAVKAKNAFQKDAEGKVLANNTTAARTHGDMSLGEWQDEVANPIIDSRQHFGQTPYKAGQRIIGFGHLITREDMKAVNAQYHYEQVLRKLHERIRLPVLTDNPAMIKVGKSLQRLAMSRGPGTVTRLLPRSSQSLPKEWNKAVAAPLELNAVNTFLNSADNFVRIVLGHVMEEDRDYVLLGKGPFARDYKAMRLEKQALQAAGEMPNNLDSLSEWLANHHNEHLAEGAEPVTPGDVRKALIDEVTNYMGEITKHTAETELAANAAAMEVVVYENGFTRPRGGKIAPGTLYQYGLPDRAAMVAKGNDAVEFYTIRYRDALQALHNSFLDNRTKLRAKQKEMYGSEGILAKWKMDRGIRGGDDPLLEREQMTLEETERNIARSSRFLNNINRILKDRQELYGDDIANRTFLPWAGSLVGSVLMRPLTWIRNGSSGTVLWGMMTGEIRKGGWMYVPIEVLKNHIASFTKTIQIKFIPKDAKQAAYKRALETPGVNTVIAEEGSRILQEAMRREELRRAGVIDTFSTREYLGLDAERSALQNLKAAIDTLRNVGARTETSLTKEIFSYVGIIPRTYQILTRKIGMRNADNWINAKSTHFAAGLSEALRYRSIKSFDSRLENDPVFRQYYEQYGDNLQRFLLQLVGRGQGAVLTPAELTGKWDPRTTRKAAIQLRRLFSNNNDSVDSIMLKYWWNQRHANGNKQAPFMTDGQSMGLMFAMAENVNMGTLSNRAQWFVGSKYRQLAGVLSQYWLWNTDKLVDLISKPRGERTLGVRYLPGTLGFLLVSAIAGVVSTTIGQKANNAAFNTVSQKPDFLDATDDETRFKILVSNAAGYYGALGSLAAKLTDQPGKLGYNNPVFFGNVLTDVMNVGVKSWQTGDVLNPTMDFMAKYLPPFQAIINRLPGREGLMDVRNASNALRAATPSSLEAKRRQPSAGSDFSLTPMTPLYNGIVNAAERGDWAQADELMAKAVEQQRAMGNANPEAAILSAIRTRSPESAVYQRVLTDEERAMVYGRLSPENLANVERVNRTFDELAMRYGRGATAGGGGGGGGRVGSFGRLGGLTPRFGQLSPVAASGPIAGGGSLSLGGGGGVRSGFRTRSLRRGGRMRSLLRSRRPRRLRTRLPRLRA